MARARKKTAEQTESPAQQTAAAHDAHDVFGEAIAAAQARQGQAPRPRPAEQANHQGGGHAERPAHGVEPAGLDGQDVARDQERPRRRSTEMLTDTAARMRLHSNHENYRV